MIPLLLATAGRAVAGAAGRAVAAKGVVSALKNRGYISEAGKSASQMARAGSAPRANTQAFRNPYTFAKKTAPDTESSTMGTSAEEPNQTQSNTKKQTLIISADNVFLRTSQAIMESTMPQAPQNIERASGSDELTSNAPRDPSKSGGLGTAAGIILGKLLYKVLNTIVEKVKETFNSVVEKIKETFKNIQISFLELLSGVYTALDKITPGKYFKEKAASIDEKISKLKAPETPAPTITASNQPPETTGAPAPAVPVSTPSSPASTYAPPTGFFGPPTVGTQKATTASAPAIVSNSNTVQSLFTKMDDKKTSGKNTSNISANSSSPDINETIEYFKDAEGVVLRPYWDYNHWRIGIGSDTYVDTDGKQKEVGGKDGKNKSIKPNLTITEEQAYADVKIRLERDFKPGVVKSLGADNYNKLTPKQQAALLSYAYNTGVGSSKSGTGFGGLIKKGLREAIQSGDTLSASNIISKGITTAKDTSTGVREVVPSLVKRRKEESEMFKQDSIKAPPTATMNIKPQSSAGSLSAPTQATGRNIETTSQILNSAPTVTTAQNSQPVVINNINAPTVASGKGSSGPAIELSLFRNIDNSILANTNRHLRAGILGV